MKLIAVTNDRMPLVDLIETLEVIEPYMDAVILREKSKSKPDLLKLIRHLKESNFDDKKIIVHGNPEIAASEQVDYVQLPGRGFPLQILKEQFPTLSFGKSVHSFEEAKNAAAEGADSVLYGHLFQTNSKPGLQPRGIEEISKIAAGLEIPVYAIGGILPHHIKTLIDLNIAGIAVMSTIFNSEHPKEAAKSYYDAIHNRKGTYL